METNVVEDLLSEDCCAVAGGRMKTIGQHANGGILISPDGEPVTVIVDGVVTNSPADGFVHV